MPTAIALFSFAIALHSIPFLGGDMTSYVRMCHQALTEPGDNLGDHCMLLGAAEYVDAELTRSSEAARQQAAMRLATTLFCWPGTYPWFDSGTYTKDFRALRPVITSRFLWEWLLWFSGTQGQPVF